MSDAATATATEHDQPTLQLPENTAAVLRQILDAGGVCHLSDDDTTIVTGPPEKPGQPVPVSVIDMLGMVARMLVAGERMLILTTRRGRHFARHGTLATFDESTTDVDLPAWARGSIDYMSQELFEAIEAHHYRVALTRAEALEILINLGVVSAEEARRDVD
jgi:hypothetical protein